jgi:hypothetical protein
MIKYFIGIFIFCIVLFLYLHINYHLKTSNDLEVYSIERPSKERLEEICNIRQPVIFDFYNESILENCSLAKLDDDYGAFDINMRDISNKDENSEMYLPFLLKEAINIFRDDENEKFVSEKNQDFLKETGAIKNYSYNDGFLRPPLVSKCIYDIMTGSVGSKTPLRYNLNYRNFYYVTTGKINIKLIPPHHSKYLYSVKDYDNFEFRSPVNVWNIQSQYKSDFNKVKVLDVTLNKGEIIHIPAFWWYSIEYEKISSVCSFQYRTFMNVLAIFPQLVLAMLQGQNIKRNIANKLDTEIKNTDDNESKKDSNDIKKET